MDFLWALLVMVLAVLLYTAWQILRFVQQHVRREVASVRRSAFPQRPPAEANGRSLRQLQRISLDEFTRFTRVLAAVDDLIVVDLENRRAPFPLPAAQVLSAGPGELPELLEWAPLKPKRGLLWSVEAFASSDPGKSLHVWFCASLPTQRQRCPGGGCVPPSGAVPATRRRPRGVQRENPKKANKEYVDCNQNFRP